MNKRVTVDFDEESYYLDGEYWTSWDHYGEQMAEEINKLLDKQDKKIKDKEDLIRAKNQQLGDIKQILTEHYEYSKEKCEEYQTNIVIYSTYDLLRYSFKQILNELGWD